MLFVTRLILIFADLIPVTYSIIGMRKKQLPDYFKAAFLGLLSMFLADIYYLALSTDSSLDEFFTVGVFGEVAAYLFILMANMAFIPKKESETKSKVSFAGIIVAGLSVVFCILSAVIYPDAGNIVYSLIIAITIGPSIYFSVKTWINHEGNPYKKSIRGYNILISITLFYAALVEFFVAIGCMIQSESFMLWGILIASIPRSICNLISMYVLEKGVRSWEI